MKSFYNGILLLGILVTMLLPTGCISYSGEGLSKVQPFPRPVVKPSVEVKYSFHTFMNGKEQNAGELFQEKFQKKIMYRFGASGLFSSIRSAESIADSLVTVDVTHYGSGSLFLAALCGGTLGLIPCRAEDEYRIAASVLNRKTKSTSVVELVDSDVLWMHILLVPAMPFYANRGTVERDILNNMMDVLALRVYETIIDKGSVPLDSGAVVPAHTKNDFNP